MNGETSKADCWGSREAGSKLGVGGGKAVFFVFRLLRERWLPTEEGKVLFSGMRVGIGKTYFKKHSIWEAPSLTLLVPTIIEQKHESESCSVMSDSLRLHGLYSPWNSPDQNTGVGSFPFSRGSSQPRDWTQVSPLQADSLPAEPLGTPQARNSALNKTLRFYSVHSTLSFSHHWITVTQWQW